MEYTKDNPLKVIELFSGIGAQRSALQRANIPHKVVAISEIDKFALKSYNEMYNHCLDSGETINLGDITKIDPKDVPDCDFMTYSSPCQQFSIAGKLLGGEKDSGTESSLLWEVEKIIRAKKPKYLMLENVKMLVSKKFKHTFDDWLKVLDNIGYNTYWKVLNAKDFGVPQNRERVFAISIRKDVDDETFEFPKPFKLEKRLKDVLEPKVDKKFYLKPELVNRFKFVESSNNSNLVTTSPVGNLNHFAHRPMNDVFGEKSISPTLSTMQGGNTQPKVLIKANNSLGYNEAKDGYSISLDHPNSTKKHSRVTKDVSRTLTTSQDVGVIRLKYVGHIGDKDIVGDGKELSRNVPQGNRVYSSNGIAATQSANGGGIGGQTGLYYVDFSIRKLTPKECWRLMGFKDSQFEKAQSVCSNTQLYKQAGNSIVVDVLMYIFKNLFK